MAGESNDYLGRIDERLAALQGGKEGIYRSLQAELQRERAMAYSRAVERVDRAWRALADADAARKATPGAATEAAYAKVREDALQVRWELLVHRECLGFYGTEELDRDYPIPGR